MDRTNAERQRRYIARLKAQASVSNADAVAKLEARIRELEAELARRPPLAKKAQAAIKPAEPTRSGRFSEEGRLRAEIVALKSDITKLKMMLQEEPDAAKLRKKVIDQQTQMRGLRAVLKRTAEERDTYRKRTHPKFREASRMATRETYNVIIKALHSDRAKHVTATEIAEAAKRVTALRPLFDEGPQG